MAYINSMGALTTKDPDLARLTLSGTAAVGDLYTGRLGYLKD
jgi:hypothetical protein